MNVDINTTDVVSYLIEEAEDLTHEDLEEMEKVFAITKKKKASND